VSDRGGAALGDDPEGGEGSGDIIGLHLKGMEPRKKKEGLRGNSGKIDRFQ